MTREKLDGEVSGVAAMGFEWIQKPLGWRERYWKYVGASNASSVALDDLDDWISHGNPKSGGRWRPSARQLSSLHAHMSES